MQLSGSVVLITGPARGLGAGLARRLHAQGAKLALVGLEPERLQALCDELGPEHRWWEADVTSATDLDEAVQAAVAHFGRIDVAVANAGIGGYGSLEKMSLEEFRRIVEVNFFGTWHLIRSVLPALTRSRGYFLAICSGAAAFPSPGMNAYGASKAAQESLCETLRMEVSARGVDVGVAYFSFMDTDLVANVEKIERFRKMRQKLPPPLNKIYPASMAVEQLLRGIQRRSARVIAPPGLQLFLWLRGILLPWLPRAARNRNPE